MTIMLKVTYILSPAQIHMNEKTGGPTWDRPHNIISSNQLLDKDILKFICRSNRNSSDIFEGNLNL